MENSADITLFDVAPGENEIWFILVNGAILGACRQRKNAVEIAATLARAHTPARLVTRGANGEIESITPFLNRGGCRGFVEEPLTLPVDDSFELA